MKTIISKKIIAKSLLGLLVFSFVSLQSNFITSAGVVYAEEGDNPEIPADVIPPPAPTNISPANNAVDTAVAFGKFDWTDVADNISNPPSYVLEITLPASLGGGIITIPTATDSEYPIGAGSPEGDYYWRVQAIDEAGNIGPWGETWKLTINNTPVTPPVDPEATTTDPVATTTDPVATTTPDVDVSICSISPATGRTIFNFPSAKRLVSDPSFGNNADVGPETDLFPFVLTAGTYNVTLSSYDAYPERVTVSQPHEQFYAELVLGTTTVASTNPINDLADNVASTSLTEVVNTNLVIPQTTESIRAKHAFYPDASNQNSVVPLCAAFDFVTGTTTPPGGDTGTTTATTTDTTGTTTDETGGMGGGDDENPPAGGGSITTTSGGSSSRSGGHRSGGSGGSVLGASDVGGLGGGAGEVLGASISAPNTGFGPESTSTSLTLIASILFLSALGFGFYNRKALFVK